MGWGEHGGRTTMRKCISGRRMEQPSMSGWKRPRRILLLVAAVLVVVELGWFGFLRMTADRRAVAVRSLDYPASALPADGTVRIATYNTCKGKGTEANARPMDREDEMIGRLDAMAELLKSEKADIVVLNELDFDCIPTGRINQAEYIARKAEFPFFVEQRNVDARTLLFFAEQSGNAVLSRFPIRSAHFVPLPGYALWETILGGKSNGVLCTIDVAPGRSIPVFATHLESRCELVRIESVWIIEDLRKRTKDQRILVVGDLNASPQRSVTEDGGATAIGLLYAGGAYATQPAGRLSERDTTLAGATAPYAIDWIIVPEGWKINGKKVVRSPASDHWPVFMDVQTGL